MLEKSAIDALPQIYRKLLDSCGIADVPQKLIDCANGELGDEDLFLDVLEENDAYFKFIEQLNKHDLDDISNNLGNHS